MTGRDSVYNVKLYKYPAGWQVRVYSKPVGFRADGEPRDVPEVWDCFAEDGDTVAYRYNPYTQCREPFGGTLATLVPEDGAKDPDRSAKSSMCRTKNRVYYLARSNVWDWFVTLTFDPGKVDSMCYDACVSKLGSFLRTCRRKCPDVRYLMVPEHHKSGRFHFHGLFAGCDSLGFLDSGKRDGRHVVYNIGSYKLGFSTATRIDDNRKVTQYIGKYITKELCAVSVGRKRYWASRNLAEAETEEYFLEGSEREPYCNGLADMAVYMKEFGSDDITVQCYELGGDVDG